MDKVVMEHSDTKMQLAQTKMALQDMEDYIDSYKEKVANLEQMIKDKDVSMQQVEEKLGKANQQIKSLFNVQIKMKKEQKEREQ